MSDQPPGNFSPLRYEIRAMRDSDLDAVLDVERQCHLYPWSADLFCRELENPLSCIDLLWVADQLAGYVCSWRVADELHILNVATAPAFRRRGVAATLLRHLLRRSRLAGVSRAYLEVRVSNSGAISLYLFFGFQTVSRRLRYYADGEDALVMEFTLPSDPQSLTL